MTTATTTCRFWPLLTALLVLCLTLPATQGWTQTKKAPVAAVKKDKMSLSYKIIPSANNSFGYDIYKDGKMMVHQPSVPGLPGNNGFATREAAERVAGLVVQKIQKGEMPPTVSVAEMKKLKAL